MTDPRPPADGETFLELGQLVSDRSVPVPAAELGPGVRAGLWALRIFAVIVSFMVLYTFVAELH